MVPGLPLCGCMAPLVHDLLLVVWDMSRGCQYCWLGPGFVKINIFQTSLGFLIKINVMTEVLATHMIGTMGSVVNLFLLNRYQDKIL